MNNNQSLPDRRILTFPVVHPCPSISPSTLVASLSALAADVITFRTHRFPILRRAIRESLREVRILSVFFTDVINVPESAVLSLSELHVCLQRLRLLLSDCSRRGACLWILMNADGVASELRLLVRSVSTALDVLNVDSLDADDELKQMLRLLAEQSWTVEIDVDPQDDLAARSVRLILRQFATGLSPDPFDLNVVLDHLNLRSWADCSEEIAFLEEEILEHSDGRERSEISLLSSLMGLLIYCRAALFNLDYSNRPVMTAKIDRSRDYTNFISHLNPESLRCPISLELMADPVTIATGQTYDRPSLLRWLRDGCRTCPVTGERLEDTTMVPNALVYKIITTYCHLNNTPFTEPSSRKRDLSKTKAAPSAAAARATSIAAALLVQKLSAGTEEEKKRAAYEIRLLTKSIIFHRACFVEADAVAWLLHLISSSSSSSTDPHSQDNAIASLLNLSKHPSGRAAIFEIGGLSLIVDSVTAGLKPETRQNAAAVLFYLSSVHEYRREIGEIPRAVPALVDLLRTGAYRGKKNAVVALFGLLLYPGNLPKILAAGAVPVLADLLKEESGKEDLINDCIGVLAKIAETKEGTNAILRAPADVIPRLVQVLETSTARSGREYSVSVMLSLCNNGGPKVINLLEKMPALMPLLYSVLIGGPPQASKKARSLINHIHQIHEQEQDYYPAAAAPPAPVQDQIVHAR